jgi:hypothetical protein
LGVKVETKQVSQDVDLKNPVVSRAISVKDQSPKTKDQGKTKANDQNQIPGQRAKTKTKTKDQLRRPKPKT